MNLVFDFGAVLFSWQPQTILQSHFPQVANTPERAAAMAKDFFQHADWHAFDGGQVSKNEIIALTSARLNLPIPEVASLVGKIGSLLTPMQDSVALLEGLHAQRKAHPTLRLYFLSNMPAAYARELEQRHAFLQWFDGGVFSGDVQLIKPDPAIFKLMESRYALDPARSVFIDDLRANVQTAQARGWTGIHFESPQLLQEQLKPHLGLLG
jgi:putative hydrolase of the HAD superfamily